MPESILDLPADPVDIDEAIQKQFTDGVVRIIPLSSGAWAVFGFAGRLDILPNLDPVLLSEISLACTTYGKRQKSRFTTAEARFYGEPEDRQFLRDRRRANRESVPRLAQETIDDLAIDL